MRHIIKPIIIAMAFLATSAQAMLPNPMTLPTNTAAMADADMSAMSVAVYAFLVRQDINGQEVLVALTPEMAVNQGDVLEYHGYFTNRTGERLRRVNVGLDIPKTLTFIGVATPDNPSASVDGVRFSRMPLQTQVNGQVQNLAFLYYRALRWQIEDVAIDGTAVVKYRAMVK